MYKRQLQCTDAAQDLPILRPLIGMDKTEIVETARHINTFETSILPYEDCCTIFTPPHPKIRPELSEILEAEAGMPDLAELEVEAAEATELSLIHISVWLAPCARLSPVTRASQPCFLAMMLAMRIILRRMRTVKRTSGALSRIYS